MATLLVIQGVDQGRRFECDAGVLALGRDAANPIRLLDTEVSRRHAELRVDNGVYRLVDLGSSNGTYVNGRQVKEASLRSGDQVQVGRTVLLFTTRSPASGQALADKIDMVHRPAQADGSNIVRSIAPGEGSRFFSRPAEPGSPHIAKALACLQVMYRAAVEVSHIHDLDQLLSRIMELAFEVVEADRGCVLLRNPENGRFDDVRVVKHRQGIDPQEKIPNSQTLIDHVVKHRQGVITSDAGRDERFSPAQSIVRFGIREAICVPMQGRHDLVGVIYVDTSTPPHRWVVGGGQPRFTDDHLKLMDAVAHQAALAVEDTRYHEAMVQAERLAAIGQTIATLSHHIKNILQGIRGGSYLIDLGLKEHDENTVRRGWDIVEKNQNKIYYLVMDMLTFSKEREPALEEGDLNQVAADVVELMESRAVELGVLLDLATDPKMPKTVFDQEGLHRALLNIVTNALDAVAAKDDGKVLVRTEYDAPARTARVAVIDNGVGIPPEEVPHIFTLFASSKGGRGTGLGLPVSRKILREHGGDITVETKVGVGSRFTLELPVREAEIEPRGTGAKPVAVTTDDAKDAERAPLSNPAE